MQDAILNLIRSRRSIRSFEAGRDVTPEQVETLLEAARWAPNGGNVQAWRFIVVRNRALQSKLADAALAQRFLADAPVVIAVCADLRRAESSYGARGRDLYCVQDTAAAVQNILLTAHAMGLGTCWVGAFDETEVAQILGIDKALRPVAMIPVGYSAEQPAPRPRRTVAEVAERRD